MVCFKFRRYLFMNVNSINSICFQIDISTILYHTHFPKSEFQILEIPTETKLKDGNMITEYLEDEIQDKVYESVLRHAYAMYRLFWNTFQSTIRNDGLEVLKTRLSNFFSGVSI